MNWYGMVSPSMCHPSVPKYYVYRFLYKQINGTLFGCSFANYYFFSCQCVKLWFWLLTFYPIKYKVSSSRCSWCHNMWPTEVLFIFTLSNISTINKPIRAASLMMWHNNKLYVSRPVADRNDISHSKHDFKWNYGRRKHNDVDKISSGQLPPLGKIFEFQLGSRRIYHNVTCLLTSCLTHVYM